MDSPTIWDRMNSAWPDVNRSEDNFFPPSKHSDANDPVEVKGSLLSEEEWEELTDVSDAEARAALKQWKRSAPEQFDEILNAQEDE
jgi:hypothetical protein